VGLTVAEWLTLGLLAMAFASALTSVFSARSARASADATRQIVEFEQARRFEERVPRLAKTYRPRALRPGGAAAQDILLVVNDGLIAYDSVDVTLLAAELGEPQTIDTVYVRPGNIVVRPGETVTAGALGPQETLALTLEGRYEGGGPVRLRLLLRAGSHEWPHGVVLDRPATDSAPV
jgi:hypothetical protein